MINEQPIDERFRDSETGKLIDHCLVCNNELVLSGSEYFVERIFRRVPNLEIVEPIFEYAMCKSCAENMREDLSKESLKNIEAYFMGNLQKNEFTQASTETCLMTGKSINASTEFSFHAHCQGDKMLESIFPYAISDQATDEISELLSQETVDQLDDFKGKYFTGPPELADILNPKRFVPL
jgi:hypothetical protein